MEHPLESEPNWANSLRGENEMGVEDKTKEEENGSDYGSGRAMPWASLLPVALGGCGGNSSAPPPVPGDDREQTAAQPERD